MGQLDFVGGVTIKVPSGTKILKAAEYSRLVEAHAILDEARRHAAEILAEAERKAQERLQSGFAEGLKKSKETSSAYMLGIMSKSRDYLQENEERMVALVIAVLRKILGSMDEKEVVVRMVRTAMAVVSRQSQVRVMVAPDMVDTVKAQLGHILQPYPNISTVDVAGDAKLLGDQCILETKVGRVETSLESQLKSIIGALSDAAPGRKERMERDLKAIELELSADLSGRRMP